MGNESQADLISGILEYSSFDGVEFVESHNSGNLVDDVFVVFKPTQIKSATGNVGAFGQRTPMAEEAARFGMTPAQARAAQAQGDLRYSLSGRKPPGGAAKASRRGLWTRDSRDDLPTVAAKLLAQLDEAFIHPISTARDMAEVVKEVAPDFRVKKVSYGGQVAQAYEIAGTAKEKTEHRELGEMIGPAIVRVNKDGTVELDISRFHPGERGNAIYAAVGDFAANNDLTFIGDTEGLSALSQIRRTEAMLASALRRGTTRHLGSHELLENPEVQGVEPLRWKYGDDHHNLRALINASRKMLANLVPEIAEIAYNF